MSMIREDILRELELLPVWKVNATQTLAPVPQLAESVMPTVAASMVTDTPESVVVVPTQETKEYAVPAMPVAESLPVVESLLDKPVLEKIAVEKTAPEKTAIAWLLYCPLTDANVDAPANADVLALLKNMINAMQLLSTDYLLVHDAEALARYQPQQTLLFGLATANTFLGTQASTLESLGKQPIAHAQSQCWVIDHPADLLQTPMRKRHAWQIMCEAKAFAKQGAA